MRAGYAFLRADWRQIAPVALIGAAAIAPVEVWSETAAAAQDGGGRLLAMALGVLLQIPVIAAYYRRALSRGEAPLALRLGRDEVNLALVSAALMFLFVIVVVAGLIVVSSALAALASAGGIDTSRFRQLPPAEAARAFFGALGPEGRTVLGVMGAGLIGLMIWLSARLALANPATVGEGRPMIFNTWGWTKGNSGPVAACLLIVIALGAALTVAALIVPDAIAGAVFGREALRTPGSPGHWVMTYLSAAVGYVAFHAPYVGATAHLYRGQKPPA